MFHRTRILPALLLAAMAVTPAISSADDATVKSEILSWIKDAETKLIELSEAVPEGKYAWRPAKGVRSVGEVYMHVAAANFGVPEFIGVAPPEGFKFQTYEKSLTKKADIEKALKESFQHVVKSLENASDEDMNKPAEFFGMKTTARGAYLLLLTHAHEHLGQSIAYARSNNITPPWSAREAAAMREAAKEKEKAASK